MDRRAHESLSDSNSRATRASTLPVRGSTRLRGFDYRLNHACFVTICTAERQCVFGSVADDDVRLSQRGQIAAACWQEIPEHHAHVEIDAFVVMPNHIHGILSFIGEAPVGATPASPARACGPASNSLGAVIGSYKSAVSRQINRKRRGAAVGLWQRNYFEHVIRTDRAFDLIREYIINNPARWSDDVENPAVFAKAFDAHWQRIVESDMVSRKAGDAGVAPTR